MHSGCCFCVLKIDCCCCDVCATTTGRVQGLLGQEATDYAAVRALQQQVAHTCEVWGLVHKYQKLAGAMIYHAIAYLNIEDLAESMQRWIDAANSIMLSLQVRPQGLSSINGNSYP